MSADNIEKVGPTKINEQWAMGKSVSIESRPTKCRDATPLFHCPSPH